MSAIKRIAASLLTALPSPVIAWAFGADLSKPGEGLGFTVLCALLAFAWQWSAPWWDRAEAVKPTRGALL